MASLSISSIGQTSCYCTISGLSLDYNLSNYMEVGVTTTSFTNGTSSRPSGIKGTEVPTSSGTLRYADFSAYGFSSGTTYTLYAFARTLDGNYWSAGSRTFTTDSPPDPDPDPVYNLVVDARTTSSLVFTWNNGDSYDNIYYKFDHGSLLTLPGNYTGKSFSGLSSGTNYIFEIWGEKNGYTSSMKYVIGTTLSLPTLSKPVLNSSSCVITNSSLKFVWHTVTGADYYYTDYTLPNPSGQMHYITQNYITFTGLSPNTSYSITVKATGSGYNDSATATFTLTTNSRPVTTSYLQHCKTGLSMNITNNKPTPITAATWNSFTSSINTMRSYKGLSSYSFTAAVSGNDLTAVMVNQARTAINDMSPPTAVPSAVSSGQVIRQQLNDLEVSINSIP